MASELDLRHTERVETLARSLIALVQNQPGEVLLDITVDGVRCRLETVQPPAISALSPRETEIVRMVAAGYPNKTIATILEISSFTVSSYLRRIFTKLGVNSRAAMIAQLWPLDDP